MNRQDAPVQPDSESVRKTISDTAAAMSRKFPDINTAARKLIDAIDDSMWRVVMEDLIFSYAQREIYACRAVVAIENKYGPIPRSQTPGVCVGFKARNDAAKRTVLDSWLAPNGKRLGDCTGDELRDMSRQCFANAHGVMATGRFYKRLAEKMEADQKVRDVWNESDVMIERAKIWKEAENDSE